MVLASAASSRYQVAQDLIHAHPDNDHNDTPAVWTFPHWLDSAAKAIDEDHSGAA